MKSKLIATATTSLATAYLLLTGCSTAEASSNTNYIYVPSKLETLHFANVMPGMPEDAEQSQIVVYSSGVAAIVTVPNEKSMKVEWQDSTGIHEYSVSITKNYVQAVKEAKSHEKSAQIDLKFPLKVGQTWKQSIYNTPGPLIWKVNSLNATIKTPAGTFTHCIQLQYGPQGSTASNGLLQTVYYAPGLGEVYLGGGTWGAYELIKIS